jgi:hypothetical protein
VVCEIDFRTSVFVHRLRRPNAALPDERVSPTIIDGPHRAANLPLHRLARLERAFKRLHRRGRTGRKEPPDLRSLTIAIHASASLCSKVRMTRRAVSSRTLDERS